MHICLENEIQPILITQPSLFGKEIDPVTGGNLALTRLNDGTNGELYWQRLELYNNVTREIARSNNILLIDLAKDIPKTTEYFYDTVHFTNAGSSLVADKIYQALVPYLRQKMLVKN